MKRDRHNILTIWLAAGVLLLADVCAGRVSIRLERQVSLEAGPVALGQIAAITGAQTDELNRLQTLVIATFEPPINQGSLGPFEITRALARAGIAPAQVDLFGANVCRIEITAAQTPEAPLQKTEQEALPTGRTLADELTATVARLRGVPDNQIIVEWQCKDAKLLAVPADSERFECEPQSTAMLGHVRFTVVDHATEPASRVRVCGRVEQMCEVVCAVRDLTPGEVIGIDDVRIVPTRVSSARKTGYTRIAAVIGQEVARTIQASDIIAEGMVRKLMLVKRGEPVTVYSVSGPVRITAHGEARGDAGLGDDLAVRRGSDRTIVYGLVTGPGEVTVGPLVEQASEEARVAAADGESTKLPREELEQ